MFDYLRIGCAVPRIRVGDVEGNTAMSCTLLLQAAAQGAGLVLFPELGLTGYTIGDLVYQQPLLDACVQGLRQITATTRALHCAAVVGVPLKLDGRLYDCAVLAADGRICGIVPKRFPSDHGTCCESRWFSSAEDLRMDSICLQRLGLSDTDEAVPVGADLIFDLSGVRVALELGSDLWAPVPPSTFACMAGAEIVCNPAACSELVGARAYRQELVRQQSARTACVYAFCSAGCTESTQDLIFPGHSLVAENGTLLAENDSLLATGYLLCADVDLSRVRCERLHNTGIAACARSCAPVCRTVCVPMVPADCDGSLRIVEKLPFIPSQQGARRARCRDIFRMQVAGLQRRIQITGSKLVIGVSGGLDSTLALLVAARAMQAEGRPLSDVVGITMPCFGTSDRTRTNALMLMDKLGIRSEEINIRAACLQHFHDIGQDPQLFDATYENSQARERTQVLMDYAGRIGGMVVGTGDLSEMALGWCTYNGDHMSMYGVNANIPKTLIRWVIESLVELGEFPGSEDVLRDILDTPISPELLPPDAEGRIAQVTEDIVGPYALHDFFLYYILRYGYAPAKVYDLAKRAFAGDFDDATILKWLRSFYRRFFTQQFKRNCVPDGVKVGRIGLSPRGDWHMPSDATAALWLKEVDALL